MTLKQLPVFLAAARIFLVLDNWVQRQTLSQFPQVGMHKVSQGKNNGKAYPTTVGLTWTREVHHGWLTQNISLLTVQYVMACIPLLVHYNLITWPAWDEIKTMRPVLREIIEGSTTCVKHMLPRRLVSRTDYTQQRGEGAIHTVTILWNNYHINWNIGRVCLWNRWNLIYQY